MAILSYRQNGLILKRYSTSGSLQQVADMQRDLRCLGYLRQGVDGLFGLITERAVKALQHDLLHNYGEGSDGDAPCSLVDFNRSRVFEVTGQVDQQLVECISDLLDASEVPELPSCSDPEEENRKVVEKIELMENQEVPIPFLMAILRQESGLKHFNVPRGNDQDKFITVGLDTNSSQKHIVTSRGYGAGQYTLFHHPPTADEVADFMLDPEKNLEKSVEELRVRFDHFVNGPTSGTRADDRIVEFGNGPLRLCKYDETDPRHLKACRECALEAGSQSVEEDVTPLYEGSPVTHRPTQYYSKASYQSVPIRRNFECDWPYAARRYNGSGLNSYHYQLRILRRLRYA